MRVTFLADVLRAAGVPVVEVPGWRGRGKDMVGVNGVVWHHTATGQGMNDAALERILTAGRRDLPGPLSQLSPRRSGSIALVADGRCNHNGYGTWGNSAIALEFANDGVGEPFPNRQIDVGLASTAAILLFLGKSPDQGMKAHKETNPSRKIDPTGLNMNTMRAACGLHMLTLSGFTAAAAPPTRSASTSTTVVRRGIRLAALKEPLMRVKLTTPLDDHGRAWLPLDGRDNRPMVPFGDLIGVRPQGSNPARDGYWPIPETAEQDQDGVTLLTVEGGAPGGVCTLYLVVPDK